MVGSGHEHGGAGDAERDEGDAFDGVLASEERGLSVADQEAEGRTARRDGLSISKGVSLLKCGRRSVS